MKIQFSPISFQYNSPLKTLFKEGKMPTVEYGFYGDKLTKQNVSLEHLKPHSKGGASCLQNYVLASQKNNNLRGNADLVNYFNPKTALRYLQQFVDIKLPQFDGNKYISDILNTLKKLGVDFGQDNQFFKTFLDNTH